MNLEEYSEDGLRGCALLAEVIRHQHPNLAQWARHALLDEQWRRWGHDPADCPTKEVDLPELEGEELGAALALCDRIGTNGIEQRTGDRKEDRIRWEIAGFWHWIGEMLKGMADDAPAN